MIDGTTALVWWEYTQSGVLVLFLRLAQRLYLDCNEEVLVTMDLLYWLVSFNATVPFALRNIGNSLHVQATCMNVHMEMQVNMVEIICTLMRNLSPNWSSSSMTAIGVSIKKNVLKCSPSHAIAVALKANISDLASKTSTFETLFTGSTSGSWLLYGKLAKNVLNWLWAK